MFNFFNKENNKKIEDPLTKIAALLIHVAKIDENYTEKEKDIIKKAIIELGSKNDFIDNLELEIKDQFKIDADDFLDTKKLKEKFKCFTIQ